MFIEKLHDCSRAVVVKFVFDVLPPVVEEDSVLPSLAYVALASWGYLPPNDVAFLKKVQLLMAQVSNQNQLVLDFDSAANPLELRALYLKLLPF